MSDYKEKFEKWQREAKEKFGEIDKQLGLKEKIGEGAKAVVETAQKGAEKIKAENIGPPGTASHRMVGITRAPTVSKRCARASHAELVRAGCRRFVVSDRERGPGESAVEDAA